jgi:maltokinase
VEALHGLGADVLLPPRLAGSVRLPAAPAFRDALPLPGGALLSLYEAGDEVVVAPLVPEATGVRRALAGDGAFSGVLRAIGEGASRGRFLARRWGEVPDGGAERAIDADQSNDSMVVGDRAVVKLYPRTAPGPQPGLDVPAHLAAVGFGETPAPFGVLTWNDVAGRETLVASAAAYLPGARDGWDWFVELVLLALDAERTWEQAEAPAEAIGGLVARLHRALAAPSPVFRDPVASADAAAWRAPAEAVLDEALACTEGPEGERLRALADVAREAIRRLDDAGRVATIRIHGDLHVGQILSWHGGLAVADFDGNPLADPTVRVARAPAARDVASMARAIDHVGRVAWRRRPGRDEDVERWIGAARTRFLEAYRAGIGDAGALFDERLLRPFEVAQECHEFVYAARYLPGWLSIPDAAMPLLMRSVP